MFRSHLCPVTYDDFMAEKIYLVVSFGYTLVKLKMVCIIYVLQKLSSTADASKEQYGLNVAPLDVPELLENLVRQSEPLLDHLGVKKGTFLPMSISRNVIKRHFL